MKLFSMRKQVVILIIIILLFVIFALSREFISNYFVRIDLPPLILPESGSRVLIVAPHNDDESLGAAKLIEKSIKNGASVKVMMITNGDGFSEAVEIHDKKLFVKPSGYIDFGYMRQKETIDAMESLGVNSDNILFLGYPDGGISKLWGDYFNTPYTSKFTKFNTTPYNNSFRHDAEYTGENLLTDISTILNEYKPDYIVYPHPNDRHPDHWATNAFIKYALSKNSYRPRDEFLYLIHRGDWPVPRMLDKKLNLKPPFKLENTGTTWYSLSLNKNEIMEKETIIRKYKTQFPVMENLMLAFVRKNELFGNYNDYKLMNNGSPDSDIIPRDDNKIITDPKQDSLRLDISKSSDLVAIYGEISKENNFHIIIEANGKIEKHIKYTLDLTVFNSPNENRIIININNGNVHAHDQKGNDVNIDNLNITGRYAHILIPYNLYHGYDSMLLSAGTSTSNKGFDHTALRVITR